MGRQGEAQIAICCRPIPGAATSRSSVSPPRFRRGRASWIRRDGRGAGQRLCATAGMTVHMSHRMSAGGDPYMSADPWPGDCGCHEQPPMVHAQRSPRPVPRRAAVSPDAECPEPGPDRAFPLMADGTAPARGSPPDPVEADLDPGLRRDDGIFFQGQWVGSDCASGGGATEAKAPIAGGRGFGLRARKGATEAGSVARQRADVSIHAPARVRRRHSPNGFNPRTRKGATQHPIGR